jgi:hypothetical protein
VVDWEACCEGDAGFDLATLFSYTDPVGGSEQEHDHRLWDLLTVQTGPPLPGVYLARLVLRQRDESIRFREMVTIDQRLVRSDEALQRFAASTRR